MMKRKLQMAVLLAVVVGVMGFPAYAAEKSETIEIVREDVPHEEAVLDDSYDATVAARSETNNSVSRSVSWNVWGEREYQNTGSYSMVRAVGHSEQVSDGWVTSTYHYTRTFFGSTLNPIGDSGRVWGQYTVTARGSWVYSNYVGEATLKVYYGTED